MTPDQIERIAQSAAEKAVDIALPRAFALIGVDASKPIEAQADMAFLRGIRLATGRVRSAGITASVTMLVTGIFGAVWYAIKH